jgi:quercetin dioxygenase-like cupin family protein
MRIPLALAVLAAILAFAQQPAAPRPLRMTQELPEMDGKTLKVTVVEIDYALGGSSPAHSHPGAAFVYVLEGELESQIGSGPVTTYKPGQMFYEPPNGGHPVSRNASPDKHTRFLAFLLTDKGQPTSVPTPAKK